MLNMIYKYVFYQLKSQRYAVSAFVITLNLKTPTLYNKKMT